MRRKKKCSGLLSLNLDALPFAVVINLNSNRLNRHPQILEVYSKLHSTQSNRGGAGSEHTPFHDDAHIQHLIFWISQQAWTKNARSSTKLAFYVYPPLQKRVIIYFNAGFRYVLASMFVTCGIHSY